MCFRQYRQSRMETPTYTGGVSDAYRESRSRREKEKHRDGLYSSSKKGSKNLSEPHIYGLKKLILYRKGSIKTRKRL